MERDTLLLSRQDVAACLDMPCAIEVVRRVYEAHATTDVVMAPKSVLDLKAAGIPAWTNATPAYYGPIGAAGLKWIGGYAANPRAGLPYMIGLVVLHEPSTGVPLAIMDGSEITAIKTGATAGVCAEALAGPGSHRVALIGAGAQGSSCLRGIAAAASAVRGDGSHVGRGSSMGIEQARIYDIEPPAAAAAARRLTSEFQIDALVCSSACEAVRGASIIVTATQADEPLVMDEWVAPGATVISIGSWQEFDEEFVLNAKLVVDIYEHCIHRGELARLIQSGRITRHSIHALLGEVISGRKPGRQDPHERILVVPMGMGTHDVALAKTAFDNAMARGAGTSFRFF